MKPTARSKEISEATARAMQTMTTEELFKLRDEQEKSSKARSLAYASKLRKRSPKPYKDPTEFLSPVHKERDRKRQYYREKAERDNQSKRDLQDKVDNFLEQLRSKQDDDIESNAHVLADIMKSFSLTFGVGPEKIANIIAEEEGNINVEDMRKKILKNGE